jgi:UDP-N-acetylmuramate--alanine ligase
VTSYPDTPAEQILAHPQKIHIIGVGGAGMSAIGQVLLAMGHEVSGSDLKMSASLERLQALGATTFVGHDADQLGEAEVVAISTAIPERNSELAAARERGLVVLRRKQMLAAIAGQRKTLAVGGTHGKTTTSSMIALVLRRAGLNPSFIIGGDVNEIGTGAAWADGEWFVVEADESDGTFIELPRDAAIVTNIEPDHIEHYGGFDGLLDAFGEFVSEAIGPVVVCADDDLAREIGARHDAVTYGVHPEATYRMVDVAGGREGISFGIVHRGERLGQVDLPVPGMHNATNAAGAIAVCMELGAPFGAGMAAMSTYGGVARRFERRGEAGGVTFIDDYAHLPTEVEAALQAAADGEWNRVVCVFQPHRYSRTASLWDTFGDSFDVADLLVVTDIYSAGESPRPGVSGKLIVDAVLDSRPWSRLAYMPHHDELVDYLASELIAGDLCLTLGAGDLTDLPDELIARMRA